MKVFYKQVQLNPTTETDYTDLVNKPSINGVELEGDLSTEQIKVTWYGTQEEFDALPSHDPYTFYIIDDGTPVGTQDSYLDLADKPSINGQVLTGNKLPSDLDMYSRPDVDNLLASMRSIKVVATKPAAPAANTMYYVGPDSESNYHVYLYDALLNEIDLGMAMNQLYREGTAIDIDSANTISVKVDDDTIKTNTNNEIYVKKLDTTLTKGANTANAVKAVWVENGDVKEHTVNSGNSTRPVYIDGGTIKPVTQFSSGNYKSVVPYVDGNGTMTVGRKVTLHPTTNNAGAAFELDDASGGTNSIKINNGLSSDQNGIVITSGNAAKYADVTTVFGATVIPNGANLNTSTYTAVGTYYASTSSGVIVNSPDGQGAFKMVVEDPVATQYTEISGPYRYRVRKLTKFNGNQYIQGINTANGEGTIVYGPWQRVLTPDNTTDVGNEATPVWVDNGVIKAARMLHIPGSVYPAVTLPALPFVNNGGVMEIGKYIDFHTVTSSGTTPAGEDNAARLFYDDTSTDPNNNLLKIVNKYNNTQNGIVLTTGMLGYLPYVITEYVNNTKFNKNYTDVIHNKTYNVQMGGWAGVQFTADVLSGIDNMRESVRYEYASAGGGNTIKLAGLNNGSNATIQFTGSIPGNNSYVLNYAATAASAGIYTTLGTSAATNIDGYTLDINWSRTGGNYWIGIGTISVSGGETNKYRGTICVSGEGRANEKPHIEFDYSPSPRYCNYKLEIFRNY